MKRKLFLLLLFTLTTTELFSEGWSSLTINNQSFALFKEHYDEYDSKGETVTFYKKEKNGKKSEVFSFILKDATGGCNDKSIEKGSYDVHGKIISFYTLWKRQGSVDDAPYGGKIERYEVLEDGKFNRLSSELYVERYTKGYDKKSGMKFLFEKPKNKEDKKLLKSYVRSVEKNFHGKFLFSTEADNLMKRVNGAMRRATKARWQKRE